MSSTDPDNAPEQLLEASIALSLRVGALLSSPAALLLPAPARECIRELAQQQIRLASEVLRCSKAVNPSR